ncbi:MAG: endonuclease/exonuclease/phosphatase family protein [Maritimibacter sp.]
MVYRISAMLVGALLSALLAGAAFGRDIVHYQKNMLVNHADYQALVDDILTFQPDTISLQEIAKKDEVILSMLKEDYPYQHYCYVKHMSGIAILSRWPMVEGSQTCFGGLGIAGMQIDMPEGRVWALSNHIEVFFEGLRPQLMKGLLPQLRELEGPVIMAGDFNSQPDDASTRSLARAAGTQRIGQPVHSFNLGDWFGVSIDHVMATGGKGEIEQRPFFGSDHYGVVGRFTMDFTQP